MTGVKAASIAARFEYPSQSFVVVVARIFIQFNSFLYYISYFIFHITRDIT